MVKLIKICSLKNDKHKYIAYFDDNTTTKFGDSKYLDYTQHKDPKRAQLYRERHRKDLKTNDIRRAGYLSYFILWYYPNLNKAIQNYNKNVTHIVSFD
jgi:hypothetical protein